MKKILHTENLSIGFNRKKKSEIILHKDINISLNRGEFVCLIGPNGAGKSTLIKTFVGFASALSGKIFLNNREIKSYSETELAKQISVVLTEKTDTANITVKELVSMGRYPYTGFFGKLTSYDLLIVNESLEQVGIIKMQNKLCGELSDGEAQKAIIAKALAQKTPIIILDEPTAFLDLPSRIEIMQLLKNLAHKAGKTIFLSTHELDLALQYSDRLILLAQGKEIKCGTPEDLVLNRDFNDFFEKDGIEFDNDSGSFISCERNEKKINVLGEGREFNWVSKALIRNGFINDKNAEICIKINNSDKNKYSIVSKNKNEIKVNSIEELLFELKK